MFAVTPAIPIPINAPAIIDETKVSTKKVGITAIPKNIKEDLHAVIAPNQSITFTHKYIAGIAVMNTAPVK